MPWLHGAYRISLNRRPGRLFFRHHLGVADYSRWAIIQGNTVGFTVFDLYTRKSFLSKTGKNDHLKSRILLKGKIARIFRRNRKIKFNTNVSAFTVSVPNEWSRRMIVNRVMSLQRQSIAFSLAEVAAFGGCSGPIQLPTATPADANHDLDQTCQTQR